MGSYTGGTPAEDVAAALEGEDITGLPRVEREPDPGQQPPPADPPPVDPEQQVAQQQTQEEAAKLLIGEREFAPEMADDILQLVDWASSLTPEQSERISQALMDPQPARPQQPQPDPAPAPPTEPEPQPIDWGQFDEETAAVLKRQHEELEALKAQLATESQTVQQVQQLTSQQLLAQTQQHNMEVEAQVREKFLAETGLSEEDYQTLADTAGGLGIVSPYVQQFGLEEGFQRALQTALFANEEIRNKTLRAEVEREVRADLNRPRKEAAAALGPQGGTNVPDQSPANLPKNEKRSAMVADIQQMLDGT